MLGSNTKMFDSLNELLTQWHTTGYLYGVFLVFCRVGAVVALLPGFGEQFISVRIKLFVSLGLAFAIAPLVTESFNAVPQGVALYKNIFIETAAGTVIGLWIRLIFMALTIAAGFCAQTLGITNIFDSTLEPGGAPALSGFFSFTAIALIMATGGHYFFFKSIVESYHIMPFLNDLDFASISESLIEAGNASFMLGLRIALPFLGIGFLVNIGLGFVNRAMPQIPVFFVGQPLMIAIGFFLISILMPAIMLNWSDALRLFLTKHL
jgi:flagellar biosynthesis protein FliR